VYETEEWKPVFEFMDYEISSEGRVRRIGTDKYNAICVNQHGIRYLGMTKGKRQHRKGLALLVASHFLPMPESEAFDTPIHRNGDRSDCRADNLMWRPRWFAREYHAQFEAGSPRGFVVPVECVDTGEQFANSMEAAMTYGLMDRGIMVATLNNTSVWPEGLTFRVID